MKDTIYLTISKKGVEKMRKTDTDAKAGRIVSRLNIEVEDSAFNPPIVEKAVYVNDWRDGIDVEDVNFEENVITEEEAEMIRKKRIEKMKNILEEQGYSVEEIEEELKE